MFAPADLFDLTQTEHAALFVGRRHAWEVLAHLHQFVDTQLKALPRLRVVAEGAFVGPEVVIGDGTVIEPGAFVKGPAVIGRNCQIRHNAYVREDVLIGDGCVVGNACELKNALLFNNCQVPHFNYVGDSILGYKSHLGAGVVLSNVKVLPGSVMVEHEGRRHDTGLRKFGALLGDHTDIGCNSVLNPGSVIGRGSLVYPCTNWRGVLPPDSIAKNKAPVLVVTRKPA